MCGVAVAYLRSPGYPVEMPKATQHEIAASIGRTLDGVALLDLGGALSGGLYAKDERGNQTDNYVQWQIVKFQGDGL